MSKKNKKNKKSKKQVRYVSDFAMSTANGVWGAIGHGVESPVHLIAVAVQVGIEAGSKEAKLLMRTPPVPPPMVVPPLKGKREKKS
jgi:hypothetical protein